MEKIMYKRGQVGVGAIVLVALVLVIGFVGYTMFQGGGGGVGDVKPSRDPTACADSTGILTVNTPNALSQGTAVTSTLTAGVNGGKVLKSVTSGTTTFAVGDEIEVFASNSSNYLDASATTVMECGGTTISIPLYAAATANPTIRIRNDDGDFMSDDATGGTGTNQTLLSAGETLSMEVEFKGTSLESSGDGVWIVEFVAGSGANITKVSLDGVVGKSVPSVHTSVNAGSEFVAFDIPALEGAVTQRKTLTVELGSSKTLSGAILTDWYTKQSFIDDDGTIGYGVQDSDGTAKYENTADSDAFIDIA